MADDENLRLIREKSARYEEGVRNTLSRMPERRQEFRSLSDIPIRRLYTPADVPDLDYLRDLGFPGEYPYTRGVQNTLYRGRLWTMRQFSGFGTAEETNRRYKYLLKHGQTGLSVAFHFPTLKGVNSDHPLARGEVGKCGVAIDSLRDMEILFDGIPLGQVTTSMTVNHPGPVLLAMYLTVARKQGVSWDEVGGTVQNDPLKEFFAQKSFIWPPQESVKLLVDTLEFCAKHVPKWHPVSISGYHIREAGSTAQQELAFTLADGIAYVQAAVERGLDVDDFAPHLSFFFDAHMDFFEEIAKFRAARRLWAKIMKERFGAKDPKSLWLRFHTQTAGCSLTAQQPLNNTVRTAFEALSAVLGGTQSLHTNSFDEAEALPTEEAVTVALRTQQILAHETGVGNTIDPLAGSYFVEALTDEMQRAAEEYIRKIDDLGGMIAAVEAGFPQTEIIRASLEYQKEVERGERVIVGVNQFAMEEPHPLKLLKIDDSVETAQLRRIQETRKNRDNGKVERCLNEIRDTARSGANLLPPILEAVQEYALLGEVCSAIVDVFGAYQDPAVFEYRYRYRGSRQRFRSRWWFGRQHEEGPNRARLARPEHRFLGSRRVQRRRATAEKIRRFIRKERDKLTSQQATKEKRSFAQKTCVSFTVNGQPTRLDVGAGPGKIDPSDTLSSTLRDVLGLTGTKVSCEGGACGGCTVLLDGQAVLSCMQLTIECDARSITTIEGLRDPKTGELDPLQQSFVDHTAFQCGFCTPGMIMSAKALLNENPSPTEEEVREALSGNFCRCISHYQVTRSVMAASGKGP